MRILLATVVYNPLAGGLLTGKHQSTVPLPGSRFEQIAQYRDRYWHSANFEAVRELAAIARAVDRSLIPLAFGWLLHHTSCDCIILGASQLDQLEANIEALAKGPLPRDAVVACDSLWERLRGVSPKYNR